MKKTILRVLPRLLPAGALFLPLGMLTISLGGLGNLLGGLGDLLGGLGALGGASEKGTSYNIVGLIRALFEGNELFANVLKSEAMAPARPWLAVAVAGLVLGILAILAGLALSFDEEIKRLATSAMVYAGGTAGAVLALVGFSMFGAILDEVWRGIANAAAGYGAWVLLILLLVNAAVCFFQWRTAKEKARLAALAAKKRKKR